MNCPGCNTPIPQGKDRCPMCGATMEKMRSDLGLQQPEVIKTPAAEVKQSKISGPPQKKCPHCAMDIPKAAKICPYCRKKLGMSSFQKVMLTFVCLIFGLRIISSMFKSSTPPPSAKSTTTEASSPKATAPATKVETWNYGESKDEMTGETRKYATKESVNTVEFGFPYQGVQHGTIMLTESSVLFYVQKGQVICQGGDEYGTCSVQVKFDGGAPRYVQARKIGDDSTTISISDSSVYENIKHGQNLMIEVNVYQNGSPVFTFDLGGLGMAWNR